MSRQNAPTTIEKFVSTHLSQIAVEPYVPPGAAHSSADRASDSLAAGARLSGGTSSAGFGAFGRGAIVFVCGMAVGYVLSNQPEVFPLQAKTPDPGVGGAGLRIDYDLRHH
jgi:hypothetical protein